MTMEPNRSSAAQAKIGRAQQHGLELQARIVGWTASANPRPVATIATDRLSWEVRLSAFDPPPLSEWALILGDAVHNLRSALDVLVWAHVDEGTLSERQARDIAFPIWSDASKWDDNSARLLATVPAEIAQRIHGCQPFQRPEADRSGDLLPLLAELDNRDKHRLSMTTVVQVNAAQFSHSIEFHDSEAAARNSPPDVTVHVASLTSGALLLSGTTTDPIARLAGLSELHAHVGLDPGKGFIGVVQLIDMLTNYTAQVVGYVTG